MSAEVPARAVVRFNSRHALDLYRGPSVLPVEEPGTVAISLGSILPEVDGPFILETASLDYLDELIGALMAARARGTVQADMTGAAMIAAAAICIVMIAACIAGLIWVAAHPEPRYVPRHDPFANPADVTDPEGEQFLARLHDDSEIWTVAVTVPVPAPDLYTLARVRGQLASLPQAAETGPLPIAVCELGTTTEAYVEALFAKVAAEVNQ